MNDYREIINYLYHQFPQYQQLGKQAYKADLSNITVLCKKLDDPHKDLLVFILQVLMEKDL